MKSVNFDVKNMQSVIKSLFNQTISAIKSIKVSSNSYSDNRNISIRGDSRDILNALQNRVGLAGYHTVIITIKGGLYEEWFYI